MNYDVAVIGAGVFGAWTAYNLRLEGATVLLLDSYGPGNSRSSSGGESRVARIGYGPDELYSRSAARALELWKQFFDKLVQTHSSSLFQGTGVLWLAREHDPYCEATLKTLQLLGAKHERLDRDALARKFPQLELGRVTWGILETEAGVLMARRAVQAVVAEARANRVDYIQEQIAPPQSNGGGKLDSVRTTSGRTITADRFVFACGPWLPKLFPELLGDLIRVTRQEVFFFGVPPGDTVQTRRVAGVDRLQRFCLRNSKSRGSRFQSRHPFAWPEFDPDDDNRLPTTAGLEAVREYLARRVPLLADAPVTETRVCQYENTSNGDFLIDRHPGFENVWLVGGGSGHGFKHGPAVGEYAVEMMSGRGTPQSRFGFATKERVEARHVY